MYSKKTVVMIFALALLAVLASVGMRLAGVVAAQRRTAAANEAAIRQAAREFQAAKAAGTAVPVTPQGLLDPAQQDRTRMENASTGSSWNVFCSAVMLAACLAVAWASGSKRTTVSFALVAWVANGLGTAVLLYIPMALLRAAQGLLPRPYGIPAPGPPPVHMIAIAGLAAAVLWQGPLQAIIGWVIGSRIHEWRLEIRRLGRLPTTPLEEPGGGTGRCRCGAINLAKNVTCYACGSELRADALSSARDHQDG